MRQSTTRPGGRLRHRVIPRRPIIASLDDALRYGLPRPDQPEHVRAWKAENEEHLERGLHQLEAAQRHGIPTIQGFLWGRHIGADGEVKADLELMSTRVVTTAGVGYIVDAFQNLVELENMKFHGIGTGTTAEASSDTALVTEITTAYTTNSTRPTGTTTEAAANIYRTVATVGVDAAVACTEHGIFSQAATPGGVLLDRSVFAVTNLASGESIEFTYDATFPAGG